MELRRRDVIKLGVLGSAALYLPVERLARAKGTASLGTLPTPFTLPFVKPPEIDLRAAANGGTPVTSLELTMRQVSAPVLGPAGAWPQTNVWAYTGPGGQVNPTIHVDKGQPIEIMQVNALPERHPQHGYESWVSVHLHGSASLPQYDGYANDVIKPGQRKRYRYPNMQGARTLWYHDHGVHRTSENVYSGLAAQYHLHDDMERDSGIPTGAYDSPLILKDALFDQDGSLLFDDNDESSLMGDVILANGTPWPVMGVSKRRYRFRILNASISRSYKLSLSDKRAEMWAIATDGGFMPKPERISDLRIGMAERYEVIIDFTNCADGAEVILKNGSLKNNVGHANTNKVMKFKVGVGPALDLSTNEIPSSFYTPIAPRPGANYTGPDEIMGLTEAMAVKTRRLEFVRKHGMWTVNGKTWADVVNSGYRKVVADPAVNSVEIWEFANKSGGWFHPIHVHLVDFKMLSRNGKAPLPYEQGPKDVFYVGENETIRAITKFGPHEGKYMIHCHNLVHEDHDMMQQFRVGPDKGYYPSDPHDPIGADPAY
jgi:FtsP/CotA-like multicopper oxidase with cupredoxin domain